MGLVADCAGVFQFFGDCFSALPIALQLLVYAAFGGTAFIAVARSIRR